MTDPNEAPPPPAAHDEALERAKAAMAALLAGLPSAEPWAERTSPAYRPLPPA